MSSGDITTPSLSKARKSFVRARDTPGPPREYAPRDDRPASSSDDQPSDLPDDDSSSDNASADDQPADNTASDDTASDDKSVDDGSSDDTAKDTSAKLDDLDMSEDDDLPEKPKGETDHADVISETRKELAELDDLDV